MWLAIEESGEEPSHDAHFACALSIAWPNDGQTEAFEGRVDGQMTFPPRGDRGFGYDPIFIPDGQTQTFGELDPALKDSISHRAVAFAKLKALLRAKAERTVEGLWNTVGQIVTLFEPQECANYFKSCGYDPE